MRTFSLVAAIVAASALSVRAETPQILTEEPAKGSLRHGEVRLVNDGECGPGKIKRIVGGNTFKGIKRVRECIDAPSGVEVAKAPALEILKEEPPAGEVRHGKQYLVDDGTCGDGRMKLIIGGNTALGIDRMHSCIPMNAEAPTTDAAPQETRRPDERPKRVAQRRQLLDAEPPSGKLGKNEVVYVRHSRRIRCGAGEVIKVTGASGRDGRRERECVASQ